MTTSDKLSQTDSPPVRRRRVRTILAGLAGIALTSSLLVGPADAVAPSFLGQDGQLYNGSSVSVGVIRSWPGVGNYDFVLPAGRWSSGYPAYVGDVDGYWIAPGWAVAEYYCDPGSIVCDTSGPWHFRAYGGAGKHQVPYGWSRTKIVQYRLGSTPAAVTP